MGSQIWTGFFFFSLNFGQALISNSATKIVIIKETTIDEEAHGRQSYINVMFPTPNHLIILLAF